MKILVAGSANGKIDKKYLVGIDKIAAYIADNKHDLIIVGTTVGTVGEMYKGVSKRNGRIDVLSPLAYIDEAKGMKSNSLLIVDSLFTMQRLFLSNSDISVFLPGGNGTLAELFMLTDLRKSKYTKNPTIIFNIKGFYDPIRNYLDFMMSAGVLEQFQRDYFIFCDTPEEVISELKKHNKTLV